MPIRRAIRLVGRGGPMGRTESLAELLEHLLEILEAPTHLVRGDPRVGIQALRCIAQLVRDRVVGDLGRDPRKHLA